MDEEQPEHESVARIQTRLKSGGKPPKKKKKKKERRRNKRNKKSSEGCQIKRRKAKKMLPWMFMPGIESGRSRRRRESSSDSRRRRRDRRRRDRTRSRERSRGRSPRSRRSEASSHVGAKSRRRSFMEEQGLLWPRPRFPPLQRPLFRHGLNNSAEPKWRPPAHGSGSIGSHPRRPGGSRLGASVAVAVPANGTRAGASKGRRAGTNGPRRTKAVIGPNQTPKTSLRREAKFLPQRQLPPGRSLPSGGGHKGRD